MEFEEIKELSSKYLFQNYGRQEISFTGGEGCYLKGSDGREYLDLVAGIGVNDLGYAHPRIVKAIQEQAKKLIHVSNLYYVEEQARLGEKIAEIAPGDLSRSLFVNSGAEANEGALKLAVRYTGRSKVMSALNGFHGRTAAALGATGQKKYQDTFEALISNAYDYYEYGNPESVKSLISKDTAAVIVEPIQGEGGVRTASAEFFKTIRDECSDKGALMIVDEVQTGLGRTGKWFGIENFGVVPDIITMAKALGGGIPMGAVVSTDEISKVMTPGTHGTTFGGNPMAAAVACEVIDTMKEERLVEHAKELGEQWRKQIGRVKSDAIKEIRGYGLMTGIEMEFPADAQAVQRHCMDNGVLVNVCHGNTVRLIPPLILEDTEAELFNELLEDTLSLRN